MGSRKVAITSQRFLAFSSVICSVALIQYGRCHAWSESGHHIIAEIAYDLLDEAQQDELWAILLEHPRYEEDFSPPRKVKDFTRWRIGRAGYWPDVARKQPKYHRPTWRYQRGATLVIGNPPEVDVPAEPGPLPSNPTLEKLYVVQAIEFNFKVLADKSQPEGDRAIALCWLAHLVGDIHQPCHAGSIYVAGVFPKGDNGAKSIKTQAGNLHFLWDGLLGYSYDEGDVRRRRLEIIQNEKHVVVATRAAHKGRMHPQSWVDGSRAWAKQLVYTAEVLGPIRAASTGLAHELPVIKLSNDYLQNAGELAQLRAAMAGYRLAAVWRAAIGNVKRSRHE